jgi:hypothetical protein
MMMWPETAETAFPFTSKLGVGETLMGRKKKLTVAVCPSPQGTGTIEMMCGQNLTAKKCWPENDRSFRSNFIYGTMTAFPFTSKLGIPYI